MQMTEIRKQSFGVIDTVNETIVNLAEQARELLGYNALSKLVGTKAELIELTPLQTALKGLEIESLNSADVKNYKKERIIAQTRENVEKWAKELAERELRSYDSFSGPRWNLQNISEYREPVPEFVLAKAVQIKQACPECEIWIESLQDHPDPFLIVGVPDGRPYYEPVEMYYVEVWEEPKFEGRL